MSEIVTVKLQVKDIKAVRQACDDCHMVLNTMTGRMVIRDPVSGGEFILKSLGDQWELRYDNWCWSTEMENAVGEDCGKWLQRYAYHAAMNRANQLGWTVQEEVLPDGAVVLTCDVPDQFAHAW